MFKIMKGSSFNRMIADAEARGVSEAIASITSLVSSKKTIYQGPVQIKGNMHDCAVVGGDPAVSIEGNEITLSKNIVYCGGMGFYIKPNANKVSSKRGIAKEVYDKALDQAWEARDEAIAPAEKAYCEAEAAAKEVFAKAAGEAEDAYEKDK